LFSESKEQNAISSKLELDEKSTIDLFMNLTMLQKRKQILRKFI